jgi:hypothetical protein
MTCGLGSYFTGSELVGGSAVFNKDETNADVYMFCAVAVNPIILTSLIHYRQQHRPK